MLPSATKQAVRLTGTVALLAIIAACAPEAPPAEEPAAEEPAAAEAAPEADAAPVADAAPEAPAAPEVTPLEAGLAFLAENGTRANVETTATGLQYEVLASGEGATPGPQDMVTTHYHGTLIDGSVFDSSVQRGEPIAFPVNGVIGGWTEALQLMQVGDKWKLYIPPELAYGERGSPPTIGPNETLIFEVELLDVERRS